MPSFPYKEALLDILNVYSKLAIVIVQVSKCQRGYPLEKELLMLECVVIYSLPITLF